MVNKNCMYWSSDLRNSTMAYRFNINLYGNYINVDEDYRYYGLPIRPVIKL